MYKDVALQVDGLVQDCSNSSVLAMELLQSFTKPLKYSNSHYKDKTVSWPTCLYNGNPRPGNMVFILK